MPQKRKPPEDSHDLSPRSWTSFHTSRFYDDALKQLQKRDRLVRAYVAADVQAFERAWKGSQPGDRLPDRFEFKELAKLSGQYRVCQIYVGRGNYRTAILFVHDNANAYLLDVYKKTRNINQRQVDLAVEHAAAVWEEIECEQRNK